MADQLAFKMCFLFFFFAEFKFLQEKRGKKETRDKRQRGKKRMFGLAVWLGFLVWSFNFSQKHLAGGTSYLPPSGLGREILAHNVKRCVWEAVVTLGRCT